MVRFVWVMAAFLLLGCNGVEAMGAKGEFRFEDYKTAEELQKELRRLYPVGSDIEPLIEQLKTAGAKCNLSTHKKYPTTIYCVYYEREIIFSTEWRNIIRFSEDGSGKRIIEEITVVSFLQAL